VTFTLAYTDEALIEELCPVSVSVPAGPLTLQRFDELSRVSSHTMQRRFGSWRQALVRADLEARYSGRTVSAKMRAQRARTLTDAEIIAELRRVAKVTGTTIVVRADVLKHSEILGMKVLIRRFGSFRAALAAAGLKHSPMANRYERSARSSN
jgi:hypothetical protein